MLHVLCMCSFIKNESWLRVVLLRTKGCVEFLHSLLTYAFNKQGRCTSLFSLVRRTVNPFIASKDY